MTKSRWFKISLIGLSTVAVAGLGGACSTSDAGGPAAGAGGTGTSTGGAITTATGGTLAATGGTATATGGGGSTSIAGTGGAAPLTGCGDGVACPKALVASLLSFPTIDAGVVSETFGDFSATSFSGSIFVFPGVAQTPVPMYPVTSDTSGGNWHMSGMIGDYSGFGLVFNNCFKVDASMFTGISFTISGSVAVVGTGANTISMSIAQAADAVSSVWVNGHKADPATADVPANAGCCTPTGATPGQYDGTCAGPGFTVPITATPTPIVVHWTDLTAGKPVAALDPAQIEGITWAFPAPPGAGTATAVPYAADIIIDDIAFVQ
jgi:hypothetical protein